MTEVRPPSLRRYSVYAIIISMNKHIHFIGIGGIGMSALARFYVHEGWLVTGSDRVKNVVSEGLELLGIKIVYEQSASNISSNIDMVVYSDGVTKDTTGWSELEAARSSGIETISYFEALARVANEYYLIAVAGTHGKTTTTAMLADILEEASFDPTVVVGSLRTKTQSNFRAGKSKYFVVEADEYMRHFLHFKPDILIITNIDLDHPDYFADLSDVQDAFRTLVAKVPEDGFVIADVSNVHVSPILEATKATVVDYRKHLNVLMKLKQPGLHNRQNAAAATAAASTIGIDPVISTTALENFAGTWRRFEYKGDVIAVTGGRVPVYDDYAHNPQKITAAIAGARELYPDKRLIVVFQPHTYSRTQVLFSDFISTLVTADLVYLLPIYAAREENIWGVTSEKILEELNKKGTLTELFQTPTALAEHLKATVKDGDIIVVIGAGAVTEVAKELTN